MRLPKGALQPVARGFKATPPSQPMPAPPARSSHRRPSATALAAARATARGPHHRAPSHRPVPALARLETATNRRRIVEAGIDRDRLDLDLIQARGRNSAATHRAAQRKRLPRPRSGLRVERHRASRSGGSTACARVVPQVAGNGAAACRDASHLRQRGGGSGAKLSIRPDTVMSTAASGSGISLALPRCSCARVTEPLCGGGQKALRRLDPGNRGRRRIDQIAAVSAPVPQPTRAIASRSACRATTESAAPRVGSSGPM